MLKIDNIKISQNLTNEEVISLVLKRNKISTSDVTMSKIIKKSIDARNKNNVHFLYTIAIEVKNENKYPKLKKIEEPAPLTITKNRTSKYHPIIIGAGPAGLFCALTLIDNGYQPIIIEQGAPVEERITDISTFQTDRHLNTSSNVQFGEGGAGTFSDGKLTTGISSPFIKNVLEYFYEFGAPEDILYLSHPHIGTDKLVTILKNIRQYIEKKGGKYYFHTKFIDFKKDNQEITVICDNNQFTTDALVLSIGHSARSTIKMLYDRKLNIVRKNFSVGVRIEHLQDTINNSQYGTSTHLQLPPAEYKLAYHNRDTGRSCYTFCMCPGGEVIASNSEENSIVTNGMSYYKRDGKNANSALLVNILTTDFAGDNPLAGIDFQEKLESSAFILGGSNYNAPVQRVGDFLNNVPTTKLGSVIPTYKPGYTLSNLNDLFPSFISDTLKEGLIYFDKRITHFAHPDAILTGVETRSSSPVTIIRDDSLESNIGGIYPCGEGAGYAGGITSSACDGIKVAIQIIEKL